MDFSALSFTDPPCLPMCLQAQGSCPKNMTTEEYAAHTLSPVVLHELREAVHNSKWLQWSHLDQVRSRGRGQGAGLFVWRSVGGRRAGERVRDGGERERERGRAPGRGVAAEGVLVTRGAALDGGASAGGCCSRE